MMTAFMRRAVVVMLVLALGALAGCKKGGAARLEGHWRGIKATGVPSEQLPSANLFAAGMELDFHNEQVSVHTGSEKQSGKFRVVAEDKSSVTIVTDQDGMGDQQTFVFTDDKTMDWNVMPGKTIQFVRQQ